MLKHTVFCFLAAACLGMPASAQEADACVMAAQTQAELNECSAQKYKAADATLNRTYKEVIASFDSKQKDKLREAQRAWISFRDADCESRAFDYAEGSMYTAMYTDCLAELTEARTVELKHAYLLEGEPGAISETQLLGTWRALESSYGTEISLGIDSGVHHYLMRLNGLPYETGQWQIEDGSLSIIANTGGLLHMYPRVELDDDGVLTLFEEDGGAQRYKKLKQ